MRCYLMKRTDEVEERKYSTGIESVERYSHTDWAREQRAEPVCDAVIRYLLPLRAIPRMRKLP